MITYSCSNENIRYTGRWAVYDGAMTATATGSRFTFCYEGNQAVLQFDTNFMQTPYPHLYIQVDDGAMTESTLDKYLRIQTPNGGRHTVTVILKSMVEMFPRWNQPLTNRLSLASIETDSLLPLPRPRKKKKTVEFVGDSITEGVLIDENYRITEDSHWGWDQCNRPQQDDVTATYAWQLAKALDWEPLMMGYGAVGVTKGGCGGVPKAAEAYPYCFADAPVDYGYHPDYVFINHGSNDGGADSVTYTAGYVALLDAILTAHPKTQIIAMSVFNGTHAEDLEKLVAEYNERHNQHILFVNGSNWIADGPLHPWRDGHAKAAAALATVLKQELSL